MKKAIVLIGFMGVGKTTIGKELARKLQCGFIDTDAEIEEKYGMEAVDIFRTYGEAEFRKTEKEIIISAAKEKGKVVSVGGGAFLQEEIRQACMENTIVVFLDMSWEYWKDRLGLLLPTRPVLQNKSMDEIKELFEVRQKIYDDHHVRVRIDHLGVSNAVDVIYDELQMGMREE